MKEDKLVLEAMGISTKKISMSMVVLSGVLCSLTANFGSGKHSIGTLL